LAFLKSVNFSLNFSSSELKLEHGDIYFMSEKATGFDWKNRKIVTLRHAAGASKYISLKN